MKLKTKESKTCASTVMLSLTESVGTLEEEEEEEEEPPA